MNTDKAPRKDGIKRKHFWKSGENVVSDTLFVWEKGSLPQDWRDAILGSLFEKGPKDLWGNYRRISLLPVIGNVFVRVLLDRLLEHIDPNVLPKSQRGFRLNRGGGMEMIFTVRQLQDKSHGQGLVSVLYWTDKGARTVNREELILSKLGCPVKIVNQIEWIHDMKTEVCICGELLDPIYVESGMN